MGKCMSKDSMQDAVIQHISSPVRTDDGIGFALGRLSNSNNTRWVKYEDLGHLEDDKPGLAEGQVMVRSGSRSYGLTLPQGHLVSCASFVGAATRRDSKECTCGFRRPSDGGRVVSSAKTSIERQAPQVIQKLSPVVKAAIELKPYSVAMHDVENVGAKAKLIFNTPAKGRRPLGEANVNTNSNVLAVGTAPLKSAKPVTEPRENVDVDDMLPRRVSPRRPLRPSLTEKEFQAMDFLMQAKTPVKQPLLSSLKSSEDLIRPSNAQKSPSPLPSPKLAPKAQTSPPPMSSPKNAPTNSLGSSLQSILSAISDPESTSLVEEVLSKASASQSKCTDLENDMAESKASHSPLDDDSDIDSNVGVIDCADTPSSKATTTHGDSLEQSDDDGPGNTPATARSVRMRLPMEGEFCNERPLHWKASALYTNCLFEESPAKNPVKTVDPKCLPEVISKFTMATEADVRFDRRLEKPNPCEGTEAVNGSSQGDVGRGGETDSADVTPELKRKSVDETSSVREYPSPFKKVKSLTERNLSENLQLPSPGSSDSDDVAPSAGEAVKNGSHEESATGDNEIAPDVRAFLQTSKKVVLSFGPEGAGATDSDTSVNKSPALPEFQTVPGLRELFSSNSLSAVFELETLMVTSDVRRMSGHGVEGWQIVGSELTELFSNSVRPSSEGNVNRVGVSPIVEKSLSPEIKNVITSGDSYSRLPRAESSPAVGSPRCFSPEVSPKVLVQAAQEASPTSVKQGRCTDLQSQDLKSPAARNSQVSPPPAAEDILKPLRKKADITSDRKSLIPLSFATTTVEKRTSISSSIRSIRDPDSYPEASALSLEDFQFLLDSAEREEEKRGTRPASGDAGASGTWSGNSLASFGRSLLQKLRESLPSTPTSSLPSTPKMSANSTPLVSTSSTPKRTGPHANSVALSPEEIAEIWGAFEQSHLM